MVYFILLIVLFIDKVRHLYTRSFAFLLIAESIVISPATSVRERYAHGAGFFKAIP